MADRILPRPQAPLSDGAGFPTREWYDFWRQSADGAESLAEIEAQIVAIEAAIAALEASGGNSATLLGPASVTVSGTLAGGAVTFRLANDIGAPGADTYYGTDTSGAKGWYALPEPPSGGVLPVVTGEIFDDQPVFVFADDGSLIFAPASY